MFNRQVEAVLTLIALSIFADKRVFSSEITAFVRSAEKINDHLASDIAISEAKLLNWFENNRARLSEKITSNSTDFKEWFEETLVELSKFSNRDLVLDVVNKIAMADGELHISEKALQVLIETKLDQPAWKAA